MANTTQSAMSATIVAAIRETMIPNLRASLIAWEYGIKGQINKGNGTLIFPQIPDLSESSTTLSDDGTNPTAEAMTLTTVTVTPSEIGRVISVTRRARTLSAHDLTSVAANLLSFDAKRRVDTICFDALKAAGTARYSGTHAARADVATIAVAADVRKAVVKLRALNAIPFGDGGFKALTDPFVTGDLMAETATTSWIDSNKYATPEDIKRGVVGKLYGASFTESTQAPVFAAAGAASADVYTTHFLGQGSYGVGTVEDITPVFVDGSDKADALNRTTLIGYRLDMGAKALQNGAYVRFESTATAL